MKKITGSLLVIITMLLFTGSTLKSTFVDPRDQQHYTFMKFGTATWMTQSLRYRVPGDTTAQPYMKEERYRKEGLLYTFATAQAACPPGWHLPSRKEWKELMNNLPGKANALHGKIVASKQLRDTTTMNIPLAGLRLHDGRFFAYGRMTMFWTSSDTVWANQSDPRWNGEKFIGYHFYPAGKDSLNAEPTFSDNKNNGAYCRCVKNDS